MNSYRNNLPQLGDSVFLTDGGIETTFIFHDGIDLPCFASFDLVKTGRGRLHISDYFERYVEIAREAGTGIVLESPTWRASRDWGEQLGYDADELAMANRRSIALMSELRERKTTANSPIVISGCIGPRGDGYVVGERMSEQEAEEYHRDQVTVLAQTDADMISAITLTYPEEAIGITRVAQQAGIPVVIAFTTETDGRLPNGQTLEEAIHQVDAATDNGPVYYMINCAHPDHFSDALEPAPWMQRVRGMRANASRMSHAELDQAEELDDGDPHEFGALYRQLRQRFPQLTVLGGCCGTDHRHIDQVRHHCVH